MIRITKGPEPTVLLTSGWAASEAHKGEYDADPAAYDAGREKFEFKTTVYGHVTVRESLIAAQNGKCAYCEVIVPRPYADAHIDHWRPKGAVRQTKDDTPQRPGYYWLAYDWSNLLLSCLFCNRDNKKTFFPLADTSARAINHHYPLDPEEPLLIKPDSDVDPADHMEFVEELPRALTKIGKATIDVLGLDRLEHRARDALITELRHAHAQALRFWRDPHPAAAEKVSDAKAFYARAPKPDAPFSAMAKAFISANPLPSA